MPLNPSFVTKHFYSSCLALHLVLPLRQCLGATQDEVVKYDPLSRFEIWSRCRIGAASGCLGARDGRYGQACTLLDAERPGQYGTPPATESDGAMAGISRVQYGRDGYEAMMARCAQLRLGLLPVQPPSPGMRQMVAECDRMDQSMGMSVPHSR